MTVSRPTPTAAAKPNAAQRGEAMVVFDRRAVRRHRDRAAASPEAASFLLREIGDRLADRLLDIRRIFPFALDLGCHRGELGQLLAGRGGIETLIQCDVSPHMLARAAGRRVAADEEWLPFAPSSFDLVLSLLSLHWVNDLPGALIQIRQALKPDGLLLAAMLGGETLRELRACLYEAEMATAGGVSPRCSPLTDVRDVGNLLQRAGFALPTVDTETVVVSYPDPLAVFADLRSMGETNASVERRRSCSGRRLFAVARSRYAERFGDAAGRVPATFQIIYLTAWAPDAGCQPQPLRPGSARERLAEALSTVEIPASDAATPASGTPSP
jgi:SAM-dependent methyltransferase